MKNLLILFPFLFQAILFGASANDVLILQRKADNSTNEQKVLLNGTNVGLTSNATHVSLTAAGNVTGAGVNGNLTKWTGTNAIGDAAVTIDASSNIVTTGNVTANVLTGNVSSTTSNVTTLTVTNPIGVASGGTGVGNLTSNNIILGNNTGAVGFLAPGTAGNIVTSNGTVWTSAPPALPWTVSNNNATTTAADSGKGWIAETVGNATTTVTINRTAAASGWTWSLLNVSANNVTVSASSGNIILVGSGNVTGGTSAVITPSGLATFTMANATLVVAGSNVTVP